jgi:phospholipid/cholesterol/gamma-HCH transport system substrate-binding protein
VHRKSIDVMVGLFVVIGAIALLFLALQAGNLASFTRGQTYTLSANFDNIGGLKMRSPAKSAGVTVGRVSSIVLDRDTFQAKVTLTINKDYVFPKDTSAAILTSGLLGEQYVGLNPGGAPDDLADGARITQTQSAVVLENLISQFLFKSASDAGSDKKQ